MKSENNNIIIDAFKKGEVKGLSEFGKIPEYVETQISHVFLFSERVYKIYKWDNEEFNKNFVNIANINTRTEFYQDDFTWNKYFNEEVHLNLKSVIVNDDNVLLENRNEICDDLVIEMKKININENLSKLLLNNQLTEEGAHKIGFAIAKLVAEFPNKPDFNTNYYQVQKVRTEDVGKFILFAEPLIKKEESDEIAKLMQKFIDGKKENLETIGIDKMVIAIDNHSDNIFYKDGKVSFMDVYPPKKDWLLLEPLGNIVRPATDALILGGKPLYDEFLRGYQDYYKIDTINRELELYYQIESAVIRAVLLYDSYKKDGKYKNEADKYWSFVKDKIKFL